LQAISTPRIHHQAIEFYPRKPWYVRNYLSGALENIHYEGAAEKLLPLIPSEKDESMRASLAIATASQFDEAAIETVLQIYDEDVSDPERHAIIEKLFALASVGGLDLPEMPEWETTITKDWARYQNLSRRGNENAQKIIRLAQQAHSPPRRRTVDHAQPITPSHAPTTRVGRNESCPCGSGEKHKKCCLRKSNPATDETEF